MYQLRECSIQDVQPIVFTELRKFIAEDENILLCYEWTDKAGLFNRLRAYAVWIITPKQIFQSALLFGGGQAGKVVLSVEPIESIHSVSQKKGNEWEGYQVKAGSLEFWFHDRQDAASQFVAVLDKAIKDAELGRFRALSQVEIPSKQIADQLAKLIDLRKNNLITEEEFITAKKKLLQ